MEQSRLLVLFSFIMLLLIACGSGPQTETVPSEELPAVVVEVPPPELPASGPLAEVDIPEAVEPDEFDPSSISQEIFDSTKIEVQRFIGDLNGIIRRGDFNGWKGALSPQYFAKISSREFLDDINNLPRMKAQKIVLRNVEDYFKQVVMPSRADSRVDDIDFFSKQRVKAYTVNARGERLVLYDLENVGTKWFIIN